MTERLLTNEPLPDAMVKEFWSRAKQDLATLAQRILDQGHAYLAAQLFLALQLAEEAVAKRNGNHDTRSNQAT